MGRRRKNTFAKALGQLKSTKIDEKIQMLSERPTNSVMTYMTSTPSTLNPDFISSQRGQDSALNTVEPDFTQDDPALNGRDTTGLFQEDGTPRTAMPPGDTSYILGPMAAMLYVYSSSDWTMFGYIRQSDRRFVNLGYIMQNHSTGFSGQLQDWDGVNDFTGFGQLTLEQAKWFRDVQKAPGQTNDYFANGDKNYRAYYPGPPASAPDAFGRYYCIITGEPLSNPLSGVGEKEQIPGESGEPSPDDIFSAIMDRLNKGKKLSKAEEDWLEQQGLDDFYKGGNTDGGNTDDGISQETWDQIEQAFNIGMIALDIAAVIGLIFPEPGTSIAGAARLATRFGAVKGIKQSLRNRLLRGALNPLGQRTVRSGAAGRVRRQVYSGRTYQGTRGFGKTTYGTTNKATGRTYTNPGPLKGMRGTGSKTNPKGTLDTGTLPQRYIDKYGSRSVTGQQQIKLGKKAARRVFGNSYDMDGNLLFESSDQMDSRIDKLIEILQKPEHKDKLNGFVEKLLDYIEDQNQEESIEESNVLSESRKTEILKNLKNPVVIPETKQKSYKVKPKIRGLNSAIISKPVETPKEYQPKGGRDLWGQFEYNRNVRQSQEKKNETLELIGDGEQAFNYMLNDSKVMNAQQLEKFWGLHPEMYSYFYNGKKYKATRKEALDGDFLVFLVDENGEKSNILQSKLNEKLAEEHDKKMLDEYNKLNPKSKEPISFEKDYMFKKAYQKLKKEVDYKDKPAKMGYPNDPPPEMVNDRHPDFGKRPGTTMFNKLDPSTAAATPKQDDPTIDAKIEKAKNSPDKDGSNWRKELEVKIKKHRQSIK